jgi:hypothetical protein
MQVSGSVLKPRFKVGQDIWFRYKTNRPAPVSVLGFGVYPKTYDVGSLETVLILQNVEEKFLYATLEEANNE